LWTLELKKELNFEAKADGIFYIAIEDYVKFFYLTTICKYVEGSQVSFCSDEHVQGGYLV
jgi:hypothetical protein